MFLSLFLRVGVQFFLVWMSKRSGSGMFHFQWREKSLVSNDSGSMGWQQRKQSGHTFCNCKQHTAIITSQLPVVCVGNDWNECSPLNGAKDERIPFGCQQKVSSLKFRFDCHLVPNFRLDAFTKHIWNVHRMWFPFTSSGTHTHKPNRTDGLVFEFHAFPFRFLNFSIVALHSSFSISYLLFDSNHWTRSPRATVHFQTFWKSFRNRENDFKCATLPWISIVALKWIRKLRSNSTVCRRGKLWISKFWNQSFLEPLMDLFYWFKIVILCPKPR